MHIVLVYGFAHKGHHQGQERTDRKFNSSSSSLSVPKLPVSLLHKGTDGFISFRPPVCRVSLRQQSPGCGERQLPGPSRLQAALPGTAAVGSVQPHGDGRATIGLWGPTRRRSNFSTDSLTGIWGRVCRADAGSRQPVAEPQQQQTPGEIRRP